MNQMKEFQLTQEFIELNKLLKLLRWVNTGGHAKMATQEGDVLRNGAPELRVRAKLVKGDVIEFEGKKVKLV